MRATDGLRWTPIVAYAWTAGGKLWWPAKFQELLAGTGMIPALAIPPLSHALPAVELLIAVALAARACVVPSLLLSIFLSTVFAEVHSYLWINGVVVPCGCLGVAVRFQSGAVAAGMFALSIAMLVCSLLLVFARDGRLRPPTVRSTPATAPPSCTA